MLRPEVVFGADGRKFFGFLPFVGAIMDAVTGVSPAPPQLGAPPPPPLSLADNAVSDKLLLDAGFEVQ